MASQGLQMNGNFNQDDNGWKVWVAIVLWTIIVTIVMAVLSSCRTVHAPVVPPVETHNEQTNETSKDNTENTVIYEREVKDSTIIIYRDSLKIIERWRYERDYTYEKYLRNVIDSLTKLKQDSIPYPVYVDKEVPAQLSNWQGFLITLGKVFLFVIGLALIFAFVKRRFFKIS